MTQPTKPTSTSAAKTDAGFATETGGPLAAPQGLNNVSTDARTPYRQCAPDHFRTRLHIEYDGTDFCGWQRQTTLPSVQGTIEAALSKIYDRKITVLGASRTDSGVHALQQVAHFDAPRDPSTFDLRYAIQRMSPASVVVKELFSAPADFHSIACVENKTYKYRVLNHRVPSPILHRYTHWVRFPLDVEYLNRTAQFFVGNQDFKAFQSAGTIVLTTVRTIFDAHWKRIDDDILEFSITGDGFLKQMVRNIVGTMIGMNQEGDPPEKVKEILATLDRRRAGVTAPPQGLFLHTVKYPELIDNGCRKL